MPRLPVRPRPFPAESLSSWLIRLAHANGQRLTYLTTQLTQDPNYWVHDPDRHLRSVVADALAEASGLEHVALRAMLLTRFDDRLFPRLGRQASVRWVLPLVSQGYRRPRNTALYCPGCLAEPANVHLPLTWRLSFMTACERHALQLRDACPHCAASFAPALNDLGVGQNWSLNAQLPFRWCWRCGGDLRTGGEPASAADLDFQARLTRALESGWMPWDTLLEVPALEGFDVLHQLLNVLMQPAPGKYMAEVALQLGPQTLPERRNRSFEDFDLPGRRALLGQLAHLISSWPDRLLEVCEGADLTRRPLVLNLPEIPSWYDVVAEQVSRANGHRPYRRVPLVPHLTLDGIAQRRAAAATPSEYRRWEILWHYQQHPEMLPISRKLGLSWELVWRTVTRFNALGPAGVVEVRRGVVNPKKRLLSLTQEEELRVFLSAGKVSNAQMADWIEGRVGRRPSPSTLWTYRRGMENHSKTGRRAGREAQDSSAAPERSAP